MASRTRRPALTLVALALVATLAALLTACSAPEAPEESEELVVAEGEVSPEERPDAPVCLLGEPFVAEGAVEAREAEPGDAHRLDALRWERHEGCERLVIDLVDQDGRPAERAGRVTAQVLRELGMVRVALRDVEWVEPDATEGTFAGPLALGAFALFSRDGRWVDVDVHLAAAAEAHVTTLDEPARVVVDLRPGGSAVPDPAPRERHVVVLEPRPGAASYPLTVTGYARTFEANVVVRLEQDGEDLYQDFTTATAWADAWGHFSFTIEEGPRGNVVLHVGEHSAKDGTWQGVAVELEIR